MYLAKFFDQFSRIGIKVDLVILWCLNQITRMDKEKLLRSTVILVALGGATISGYVYGELKSDRGGSDFGNITYSDNQLDTGQQDLLDDFPQIVTPPGCECPLTDQYGAEVAESNQSINQTKQAQFDQAAIG